LVSRIRKNLYASPKIAGKMSQFGSQVKPTEGEVHGTPHRMEGVVSFVCRNVGEVDGIATIGRFVLDKNEHPLI
jgi:hypothetical protein